MGSIPSSDSRRPRIPAARPSLRLSPRGRSDPAFRGFWSRLTTSPERAPCAMDSHVHSGSAPRVSHPLGGFLAYPGFAAFGPSSPRSPTCRCRSGPSPSRFHPQESRVPSGTAGSLVVRVGVAFECGQSCPDLPGLPPTPATFRPTLTEAPGLLPCDLVCGRPRRGGRSPSRARATFPHGPESMIPRHSQARRTVLTLATLRRPRSVLPPACPTPFLSIAPDSWVVTFVGFCPSRASFQLQASGPD